MTDLFSMQSSYPDEPLSLAEDQRLWVPDTFFHNEQSAHAHDIDRPNEVLQVGYKYDLYSTTNYTNTDLHRRSSELPQTVDDGVLVSDELGNVSARPTTLCHRVWQL
jgi:hypothetical protein